MKFQLSKKRLKYSN